MCFPPSAFRIWNPLPTVSSIFFPPSAFRIWKRVRAGGVLPTVGFFPPPRGVLPTVGFFFLLSAFRIWKQGRAGGGLLPRLSGFGNRTVISIFFLRKFFNGLPNLETGWCVCYNRGGPQPNCVIDLFCSLGLPNLETGWCVCYNRGGRFPPPSNG